jgi:hypothetical protein
MTLPVVSRLEGIRLHRFVILHLRCDMRIEEGKNYLARDGQLYGPMVYVPLEAGRDPLWAFTVVGKDLMLWTREGLYAPGKEHPRDLVEEVSAPPPTRFKAERNGEVFKHKSLAELVKMVGSIDADYYGYIQRDWVPIIVRIEARWYLK